MSLARLPVDQLPRPDWQLSGKRIPLLPEAARHLGRKDADPSCGLFGESQRALTAALLPSGSHENFLGIVQMNLSIKDGSSSAGRQETSSSAIGSRAVDLHVFKESSVRTAW